MAAPSDSVDQPLSDQTVRNIISPHLGGSRVRVHLTNRFGNAPLTIAHATIGSAADGGGVIVGTLRQLTFSGNRSVTIPAGADIVSDPVNATVVAFHKLAISIAVPGDVAQPTEHFGSREINYSTAAGSGDHTTDLGAGAFTPNNSPGRASGWLFLEGLDVIATARTGAVVTFGDSITDGFQGMDTPVTEDLTTVGKEERYPDFLQRRLDAAHIPLSVLNAGISGNRLLQGGQIPQFGPSGLSRLDADAIHQAGVRTVIVLEGINDIGQAPPGGLTAQQLIDGYIQLIARLHAAHLHVLLGTLTPSGGDPIPTYGLTADQIRVPVNQWIRTQHLSDGVVDFDAAVRDPTDPSRLNPAYDGSDHLHFSAAGYQALANTVPLNQLSTPSCKPAPTAPSPTTPVAHAGCPAPTGSLSGRTLGPVKLGEKRARARRGLLLRRRGRAPYTDVFCFRPIGIRVGFPPPTVAARLTRSTRAAVAGRVVLILTANAHYALRGVHPGASLTSAKRKLRLGRPIQTGANTWYLTPITRAMGVLKVRHGRVAEVGIADPRLTHPRPLARRFLASF